MRKIFLSFLMVLIIQPVFAGKRICCGIDPDTFIIKNVEIEGQTQKSSRRSKLGIRRT